MPVNDSSLKICVGYHKPYFLCKSDFMCPIQGGRAVANVENKDGKCDIAAQQWLIDNTIGDDTGDNISNLNRNFCEMTIQYWVWKNYEKIGNPDYVGFMQYRRHFILNPIFDKIKRSAFNLCYQVVSVRAPDNNYFNVIGLNKKNILKILKDYDVILTKKTDFSLIGIKSMREDWEKVISGTHIEDLDKFTAYLKQVNPEFGEYFEKKSYEPQQHLYLCFITSKKIFKEYAEFVFPILLDFNKILDVSQYSVNGKRTMGYLAERLWSVYFDFMEQKKSYKLKEVNMTLILDSGLREKNKFYLYLKYYEYWFESKLLWGKWKNIYREKRKNIRAKLKDAGPMFINNKKFKARDYAQSSTKN